MLSVQRTAYTSLQISGLLFWIINQYLVNLVNTKKNEPLMWICRIEKFQKTELSLKFVRDPITPTHV